MTSLGPNTTDSRFPLNAPDISVSVRQTFGIESDMEVPVGFEPTNAGFANRSVKPLHHGTVALVFYRSVSCRASLFNFTSRTPTFHLET